jgi:membrane-associated phospholipid phosphatase
VALTLILNEVFRHHLYTQGIDLIIKAQTASNKILDFLFLLLSLPIDPIPFLIGVLALMILDRRKQRGLILLVFILMNSVLTAFLKAYHCDPRPFWTDDQVRNIGMACPIDFGNPSGHSWFSAVLGFGVLMDYQDSGRKGLAVAISILMIVLVPLSRMHLGVHSLNQVLEGLICGLAMCLFFRLGLKNCIHKFLS